MGFARQVSPIIPYPMGPIWRPSRRMGLVTAMVDMVLLRGNNTSVNLFLINVISWWKNWDDVVFMYCSKGDMSCAARLVIGGPHHFFDSRHDVMLGVWTGSHLAILLDVGLACVQATRP